MSPLIKFAMVSILGSLGALAAPTTASSSLGNFLIFDTDFGYGSGGCLQANGQELPGSFPSSTGCTSIFTVTTVSNGVTVSTSDGNCGVVSGAFSCAASIPSTVFTLETLFGDAQGPCLLFNNNNWKIDSTGSFTTTGSGDEFCLGFVAGIDA